MNDQPPTAAPQACCPSHSCELKKLRSHLDGVNERLDQLIGLAERLELLERRVEGIEQFHQSVATV